MRGAHWQRRLATAVAPRTVQSSSPIAPRRPIYRQLPVDPATGKPVAKPTVPAGFVRKERQTALGAKALDIFHRLAVGSEPNSPA